MVHVPITLMAASAGVWLFFVQHQFEHTSWDRDGAWDWHQAALHGSSHYDLPAILRWFTGNIGVHHVHHLCSQIPFYRLPRVLSENPRLRDVGRLTLLESFGCVRLVLWDETRRCLVSFRQVAGVGLGAARKIRRRYSAIWSRPSAVRSSTVARPVKSTS